MGQIPGDASADQMDAIADMVDAYSLGEVRVTHEQNLVLPHVRQKDLPAIFAKLQALDLAAPNAGLITDIIACPGLDYCDLANARSIPIAQTIAKKFENLDRQHEIGELKIKISGCINACGHHHAGHIGSLGEVRVTHEQNLVLPHVRKQDLPAIYARLKELDFASPNAGLITDIIACPGLDYCDLANARSIPIAQKLAKRFENLTRQHQIGELKIKISGCINACGHHHAGHIGILGVDKKGVEFYQLVLGGSGAEDASVGTIMGPGFGEHEIADAVERVVDVYLAERKDGERFLDTYRRIGMEKFKAAAYQGAAAA